MSKNVQRAGKLFGGLVICLSPAFSCWRTLCGPPAAIRRDNKSLLHPSHPQLHFSLPYRPPCCWKVYARVRCQLPTGRLPLSRTSANRPLTSARSFSFGPTPAHPRPASSNLAPTLHPRSLHSLIHSPVLLRVPARVLYSLVLGLVRSAFARFFDPRTLQAKKYR